MTITESEHDEDRATDRYMVFSADTHAGPEFADFRPYVEQRHLEAFDEELRIRSTLVYEDVGEAQGKSDEMIELQKDQRGSLDPEAKARDEEADGIAACVIYPNGPTPFCPSYRDRSLLGLTEHSIELRAAGKRVHNRWLADFCSTYPDRFFGIAQIEIQDVEGAVAEIAWAHEHGVRGGISFPGMAPAGEYPGLHDPVYEPLWAICEDLNMPLNTHGVDALPDHLYPHGDHANILLTLTEVTFFGTRHVWWLMWTGVFDRHPGLKVAFAELLADWIPRTLADLESTLHSNLGAEGLSTLKSTPKEYWNQNCFVGASFMSRAEVEARDDMGADRVMWGSDYPHVEGTWPHTRESLRLSLAGVPVDDIRKLVGENAAECYGFDVEKAQAFAHEFGPTVAEINTPLDEIPDTTQARLSMAFREGDHWT